jgi:hypothetical protein
MERWKKYFYETLDIKDDVEIREKVICQGYEYQIEPQTKDEIWEIIRTLQNNKLQTEGNISGELIENGDKKILGRNLRTDGSNMSIKNTRELVNCNYRVYAALYIRREIKCKVAIKEGPPSCML